MTRRRWLSALVLALGIALGAPFLARRLARDGVSITVDEIVGLERQREKGWLGRVTGALKTAGSAALGGDVTARLRARNVTPIPVWVKAARFQVRADDRYVGRGRWTASEGAVLFWPGQEVPLVVTLDTEAAAMRSAGVRFVLGKGMVASASGEVEAGVPPLFFRFPVEIRSVALPRPE